ncbi:MAG: glycosyltransferase family 4 protein [Bacteroidota bacterium]
MKIIIYSSTFLPNIGGLENIMAGLAAEFTMMGHDVIVFTSTKQTDKKSDLSYSVFVRKSWIQIHSAISKADIYLEANISLKNIFPGLFNRKKWWLVNHIQYNHKGARTAFLKQFFAQLAHNISVSNFIANTLKVKSTVIHNFYGTEFIQQNFSERSIDLLFLGRLVSDKGVDRLINTFIQHKIKINCLIIGDGPEKAALEKLVKENQLEGQIKFSSSIRGLELVNTLNKAKVLVIPSIWDEPFGVVALEGMACGCTIACSNKPGLVEASGGLAFYFEPNDTVSIQSTIKEALAFKPDNAYHQKLNNHLAMHKRSFIAKKYIDLFENTTL